MKSKINNFQKFNNSDLVNASLLYLEEKIDDICQTYALNYVKKLR